MTALGKPVSRAPEPSPRNARARCEHVNQNWRRSLDSVTECLIYEKDLIFARILNDMYPWSMQRMEP